MASAAKETIDALLDHRTGQKRRKDDWMVGQYLRQTDPLMYRTLRNAAIAAELQALKSGFGYNENDKNSKY